jgi:hypothetical protein
MTRNAGIDVMRCTGSSTMIEETMTTPNVPAIPANMGPNVPPRKILRGFPPEAARSEVMGCTEVSRIVLIICGGTYAEPVHERSSVNWRLGQVRGDSRFDSQNQRVEDEVGRQECICADRGGVEDLLGLWSTSKCEDDLKEEEGQVCGMELVS